MEPFVGQITLFPFSFAPTGWALCEGQILPISQYTALFSLIGTYYGGNGISNFALPDLRGRAPIGQGQGPGAFVLSDRFAAGRRDGHVFRPRNRPRIRMLFRLSPSPRPPTRPAGLCRPRAMARVGAGLRSTPTRPCNRRPPRPWRPGRSAFPAATSRIPICSPISRSTGASPCKGFSLPGLEGKGQRGRRALEGERDHGRTVSQSDRSFSVRVCPQGLGALRGPAVADQSEPGVVLADRHLLWRRRRQTNFALPDLRGRLAPAFGQGGGLSPYVVGQQGGQETHTLTV